MPCMASLGHSMILTLFICLKDRQTIEYQKEYTNGKLKDNEDGNDHKNNNLSPF